MLLGCESWQQHAGHQCVSSPACCTPCSQRAG